MSISSYDLGSIDQANSSIKKNQIKEPHQTIYLLFRSLKYQLRDLSHVSKETAKEIEENIIRLELNK